MPTSVSSSSTDQDSCVSRSQSQARFSDSLCVLFRYRCPRFRAHAACPDFLTLSYTLFQLRGSSFFRQWDAFPRFMFRAPGNERQDQ